MNNRFDAWRQGVEKTLIQSIPAATTHPEQLHKAIHYTLFNGGKRIRPILVYATGELFGIETGTLDPAAAAVELIHTYSLVHDDLPAMDDDDLRRGKPTCHRAFDEATAILAGDALQTLAFQTLAAAPAVDQVRLEWIRQLGLGSGTEGMIGGQMIDLEAEERSLSDNELRTMHQKKTGALIRSSVLMGATPANPEASVMATLRQFADSIGLAFQVQDDILDVEGSSETIGKPQGSDLERGKTTFVSLHGVDGAKRELQRLHQQAQEALAPFGERAEGLQQITTFITQRDH